MFVLPPEADIAELERHIGNGARLVRQTLEAVDGGKTVIAEQEHIDHEKSHSRLREGQKSQCHSHWHDPCPS